MPPEQLSLNAVPGWMRGVDRWVFRTILRYQVRATEPGDLVELGAYMGKSAIVMGRFLQPGEKFTVCDLFEDVTASDQLHPDDRNNYRSLTEDAFRANYLSFHEELPTIVRGWSSTILDHVEPGSCRFIHIDASHEYRHVAADADAARHLLREDGVVAFDDFRAEHTPGTAAAVWESVANKALHPICVTPRKLYGTWGDPEPIRRRLVQRLKKSDRFAGEVHRTVRDEPMIRIFNRDRATDE